MHTNNGEEQDGIHGEIESFEEKQRREMLEFQERQRREREEFEKKEHADLKEFEEHLEDEHRNVQIKIDRQEFHVKERFLTGTRLRALPTPPIGGERDLFEVVPGGPDRKIEANQKVPMRDGLRFFTAPGQINPGKGE